MRRKTFSYRGIFERFGYPLTKSHALPRSLLARTEKRLGVHIPAALREYYLVAGNEKQFNRSNQRFLHPSKWFVNGKYLVFLEENQYVCWWGVSLKRRNATDPAVAQGIRDEEIIWVTEARKCSFFLTMMLHYQAAFGGFPFCGSAAAPDNLHEMLKEDWDYVGEMSQLWAFSRQNQVVCVTVNSFIPFMPAMMLFAGGKTKDDFRSIGESLSITLQ
jgi:hypothetical protein